MSLVTGILERTRWLLKLYQWGHVRPPLNLPPPFDMFSFSLLPYPVFLFNITYEIVRAKWSIARALLRHA